MTKEQFQAAGRSSQDREADRMAVYSRTAERLADDPAAGTSTQAAMMPRPRQSMGRQKIDVRESVRASVLGSSMTVSIKSEIRNQKSEGKGKIRNPKKGSLPFGILGFLHSFGLLTAGVLDSDFGF